MTCSAPNSKLKLIEPTILILPEILKKYKKALQTPVVSKTRARKTASHPGYKQVPTVKEKKAGGPSSHNISLPQANQVNRAS